MKLMLCALMVAVVALPAWAIQGGTDSIPPVREAAQFAAELQVGEVEAEWVGRLTRRSIGYLEGLVLPHGEFLLETILANSELSACEYEFARRVALGLKLAEDLYDLPLDELWADAMAGDELAAYAYAIVFANEFGFWDAWKYLAQYWRADELIVQALQVAFILEHPDVF